MGKQNRSPLGGTEASSAIWIGFCPFCHPTNITVSHSTARPLCLSIETLRPLKPITILTTSDLERARRFFIRARQVRTGLAQTASSGRWAHCRLTSRAGMAGAVSRWLGSVEGLSEIVQRLLRVQIENDLAINVIKRYASPETLFYCDTPYPHQSRGDSKAYRYEMSDDDHRKLADVLRQL